MRRWLIAVAAIGLVGCMANQSQALLVVNGSFEDGTDPPFSGFRTLSTGSTDITGWTVTGHSIDWIGDYWQAADGLRSVDLAGLGDGGVLANSFATVVGQEYLLRFAMAGNPDGSGQPVKTMQVTVDGLPTIDYTFDTTSRTRSDMGWVFHTVQFTATEAETTLSFANKPGLDPAYYGAALDAVSVQAIPEPTSAAIWSVLVGTAFAVGWRRRR